MRGALLAVGRPDGRAHALTSAENTVCLSVNQASSIQNMGVTCESITLGHNPVKLELAADALNLPDTRPRFFSEWALGQARGQGCHASSTMAKLSPAFKQRSSSIVVTDTTFKKTVDRLAAFTASRETSPASARCASGRSASGRLGSATSPGGNHFTDRVSLARGFEISAETLPEHSPGAFPYIPTEVCPTSLSLSADAH